MEYKNVKKSRRYVKNLFVFLKVIYFLLKNIFKIIDNQNYIFLRKKTSQYYFFLIVKNLFTFTFRLFINKKIFQKILIVKSFYRKYFEINILTI